MNSPIEVSHLHLTTTASSNYSERSMSGFLFRQHIHPEKFNETWSLKFPRKGNRTKKPYTPPHIGVDFRFKDFCPEVFKSLRALFGICPIDYQVEVCGNFGYLEFMSNSKSGQFFFYTYNERFIVKTMSKSEVKVFLKILPNYFSYIKMHPHSLLTKFFGMHQVKRDGRKTISFLVMGDVFYSREMLDIHETYDLKGSTKGRRALIGESQLKDNDFLEKRRNLKVGREKARLFKAQLRQDTEFLRSLGIMDYSLLVGIHFREREKQPEVEKPDKSKNLLVPRAMYKAKRQRSQEKCLRNYRPLSTPFANQFIVPEIVTEKMFERSSLSLGMQLVEELFKSKRESLAADEKRDSESYIKAGGNNPFTDTFGGMCYRDPKTGKIGDAVYFTGIIDMLQKFNKRKKTENWLKTRFADASTVSAVNQDDYAKRLNS